MTSPGSTHDAGPVAGLVRLCVNRPWWTVSMALILTALSVLSLSRMRIDGSLGAMLGTGFPSAASAARLASDYSALDELLVLVALPDSQTDVATGQTRLLAFADRLDLAIRNDPELSTMCSRVLYRADPAISRFIRDVAVPAGLNYLDDTAFAELTRRLSPAGAREVLDQNLTMLSGAAVASAVGKEMLRDPLRLHDLIDPRLFAALGDGPAPDPQAWQNGQSPPEFSQDGRALLMHLYGARPLRDLGGAGSVTEKVSARVRALNTDDLRVQLSGGYPIAALAASMARRDSINNTVSAALVMYVFFVLLYRRFIAPILITLIAALGIGWGFGIHGTWMPQITPLSAVVAAMLAGLGVDYGIHFLSHYQAQRRQGVSSAAAAIHTGHALGTPIIAACMTTAFGFISVAGARVTMLRDFAVMGALGLVCSLVAMLTLFPASLRLVDRSATRGLGVGGQEWIVRAIAARPRTLIISSLALALASGLFLTLQPGHIPSIDNDVSVLHPKPNEPMDVAREIDRRFNSRTDSFIVELAANSPDALLSLAHDVDGALAHGSAAAIVAGTLGPATLLPDPRTAAQRAARNATLNHAAALAAFDDAVAGSPLNPDKLKPYREFLERFLSPTPPPAWTHLLKEPDLAARMLPTRFLAPNAPPPTNAVMLVRLTDKSQDRAARNTAVWTVREALAGLPGVTLTGMSVISADMDAATRHDLPLWIAIAGALVLGWLVIVFRDPRRVLLALLPVVFSMFLLLGFMCMLGIQFNSANALAMPLLAGISVDNGIFLVSEAHRLRHRPAAELVQSYAATSQAIIGAAGTTLLGFGTLYWTHTPAIQSLGIVSTVGVSASTWGALGLLLPLLILHARRNPAPSKT